MTTELKYPVGSKIKFKEEKQRYTVQAAGEEWLICTKPFNARKTVIYTIVDLEEQIRGTDNYVFSPFDYEERSDCEECLADLIKGKAGISYRNRIALDIEA